MIGQRCMLEVRGRGRSRGKSCETPLLVESDAGAAKTKKKEEKKVAD